MRVTLVNIGCKVNRVEVDAAAAQLVAAGARLVDDGSADIVVVNTCTVTAEADKKTRKAVRQALRANPHAHLLVTGCAAVMNPSWFEELDPRVHVVGKAEVVERAIELTGTSGERAGESPGAPSAEGAGEYSMLKQSSLCETAHWAVSAAAELRVEHPPAPSAADIQKNALSRFTGKTYIAPSPSVILSGESEASGVERSPASRLGERQLAGNAPLRMGEGFRTRVGIKAQDGCDNACTFCIVHVARGASRSVPFEQVVDEARLHARAGARELVLTGINLGAYEDDGRGLPDLLEALLEACPDARFRIGSIEPRDVGDSLIALMAASDGRICRHLHLPLQSGSSRVLAEMNRPYDAAFFLHLVARLRAAMPQLSISTDIIVGFPGESEADFQATLDMARAAAFSKIHVFRYSRREGTPAAARPDQVDTVILAERAHILQRLSRELAREDARRRVGVDERVLVERDGRGLTESYHPVRWDAAAYPALEPGQLVRLRLGRLDEEGAFRL